MRGYGIEGMARDRMWRALAEAEERRLSRMVAGRKPPSLRARMARRLFEAAVVIERDAVWEKMEASRRS